jgi:hypothetical protein
MDTTQKLKIGIVSYVERIWARTTLDNCVEKHFVINHKFFI